MEEEEVNTEIELLEIQLDNVLLKYDNAKFIKVLPAGMSGEDLKIWEVKFENEIKDFKIKCLT